MMREPYNFSDHAVKTVAQSTLKKDFWRPAWWKWLVFLLLVGGSVLLFRYKPAPKPVKVELLTLNYPTPTWDGSYPSVVIPLASDSGRVKFKESISLVTPTVRHDSPVNQAEVALDSGMFKLRQTDLFVSDVMPLALTRTYRVWDGHSRAFGAGGNHPYDVAPTGTRNPYTYMDLNLEDGRTVRFDRISRGAGYADDVEEHHATASEFYLARIAWNGDGWTLDFRDGRKFVFPESYNARNLAQGAPVEMRDAQGNRIRLKRDKVRNLEELIAPSGHRITFKYDGSDRIIEAEDDAGHVRKYSYNSSGHVETVADGTQLLYRFEYDPLLHARGYDPYLMTTITDGNGTVLLMNIYKDNSRVSEQRLANGDVYRYDYLFDKQHNVVETTVTLPSGQVKRLFFHDGIMSAEK
jgi:YD repeat-containing protein